MCILYAPVLLLKLYTAPYTTLNYLARVHGIQWCWCIETYLDKCTTAARALAEMTKHICARNERDETDTAHGLDIYI